MKNVKTKNDNNPTEYLKVWAMLNMTIEQAIMQMAIDEVMKFTRNEILKISLISLEYLENKQQQQVQQHSHLAIPFRYGITCLP